MKPIIEKELHRPRPPLLVEVPDVRELMVNVATRQLRAEGLQWKLIGGPRGWVWSQSPRAGKLVARGSVVTLRLRTGPIP